MTKSGKHCGKRRNCTFCAISSFGTVFKKPSAVEASESIYMRERVKSIVPFPHIDTFRRLCSRLLFENIDIMMSNFFFCHNVFHF